jgi:hypothetical protein
MLVKQECLYQIFKEIDFVETRTCYFKLLIVKLKFTIVKIFVALSFSDC